MKMDRRQFIKRAAIASVATAVATSSTATILEKLAESAEASTSDDAKPRRWGMIIDLSRCNGCKLCTQACQAGHFVPFDQEWIKVYEMKDAFGNMYYFPRPCMNCQNAPCVKVCPVGASYYDEDGTVLVDHKKCIGCRMCMAACPYAARYFNWEEPRHSPEELSHPYSPEEPWPHQSGVVEKCMFCSPHRSEKGLLPFCVIACPEGAIFFGDLNEDAVSNGRKTLEVSDVLRNRQAYQYKAELGTRPRVYYLPK